MTTALDRSQRRFCEGPPADVRLLAPAGCGKTHCLLQRSKYLVDSAPRQPPRILIVTFTRVAREELIARLAELDLGQSVEVTTLNAWGFRRIKSAYAYPKLITTKTDYHFAILNQLQSVWQKKKHKAIKAAIQTSQQWRRANAPRMLMDMIDVFKSLGFDHIRHETEDQFLAHWKHLETQHLHWRVFDQVDQLRRLEVIDAATVGAGTVTKPEKKQVFKRFFSFWRDATKHLAEEATFTLEDQKYFAFQDEQKNVDKRKHLSGAARLSQVFVDEFQDINPLDLALIRAIVDRNKCNLTIAGDDDQAIFEWRGATPDYIIEPDTFLGRQFETHILDVNYRSPSNIVDRSQALISRNARRVEKKVKSSSVQDAKIEVKCVAGVSEALAFVSELVESAIAGGRSPSRVAIVGRKRAQLIPYQVHFASKDIHFSAVEDLQVFLSAAFNKLLELLEVKCDKPKSSSRVTATILDLCDLVKRYPLKKADRESLRSYLIGERPHSVANGVEVLSSYGGSIKGSMSTAETMATAIEAFFEASSVSGTLDVLGRAFEGLQYDFGKSEEDIFFTDPPFLYLAQLAEEYGDDFDRFVEDIEKAKDTLVHVPPFEEGSSTPVSSHPLHLMTALRSKGKEFDIVVMLDVVDGIWPHRNAESEAQLESERRVFYVAFTRARQRVVLLRDRGKVPSPYISELGLAVPSKA